MRSVPRARAAVEQQPRDGVNIARYALKLLADRKQSTEAAVRDSVARVLGDDALRHLKT